MALKVGTKNKCRHCKAPIYYGEDKTWDSENHPYDWHKNRKAWRHEADNEVECFQATKDELSPPRAEPTTLCNEVMANGNGLCGRKIPPENMTENPPIYACGMHARGIIERRMQTAMADKMREDREEQQFVKRWEYKHMKDLVDELSELIGVKLTLPEFREYGGAPTTVTVQIMDLQEFAKGVIARVPARTEEFEEDSGVFGS